MFHPRISLIETFSSYAVPIRTITKPPYEVKESGWGEFDVEIKIFISDSPEKSVTLYHPLKLFQEVSEWYDEILFVNPSQFLQDMLTTTRVWKQVNKNLNMWMSSNHIY